MNLRKKRNVSAKIITACCTKEKARLPTVLVYSFGEYRTFNVTKTI